MVNDCHRNQRPHLPSPANTRIGNAIQLRHRVHTVVTVRNFQSKTRINTHATFDGFFFTVFKSGAPSTTASNAPRVRKWLKGPANENSCRVPARAPDSHNVPRGLPLCTSSSKAFNRGFTWARIPRIAVAAPSSFSARSLMVSTLEHFLDTVSSICSSGGWQNMNLKDFSEYSSTLKAARFAIFRIIRETSTAHLGAFSDHPAPQ